MTHRTKVGAALAAVAVLATLVGSEVFARARAAGEAPIDVRGLERDLDLASAIGVAIAPSGGQPLAVAAELVAQGRGARAVVRAPSPARSPRRQATPAPAPEPDVAAVDAPVGAEGTSVAETVVAAAPAGGPSADEPAVGALPRPTPNPVSYPGDGRGRLPGDDQGGGVGVIIRGGGVGEDRCEIHARGRARRGGRDEHGGTVGDAGGILINNRGPQIGRGTVPRARW